MQGSCDSPSLSLLPWKLYLELPQVSINVLLLHLISRITPIHIVLA